MRDCALPRVFDARMMTMGINKIVRDHWQLRFVEAQDLDSRNRISSRLSNSDEIRNIPLEEGRDIDDDGDGGDDDDDPAAASMIIPWQFGEVIEFGACLSPFHSAGPIALYLNLMASISYLDGAPI